MNEYNYPAQPMIRLYLKSGGQPAAVEQERAAGALLAILQPGESCVVFADNAGTEPNIFVSLTTRRLVLSAVDGGLRSIALSELNDVAPVDFNRESKRSLNRLLLKTIGGEVELGFGGNSAIAIGIWNALLWICQKNQSVPPLAGTPADA